jgi:hypothetical protein
MGRCDNCESFLPSQNVEKVLKESKIESNNMSLMSITH